MFNTYCQDLKKVRLCDAKNNKDCPNWVTMGVIVQSSGTMKSSSGANYVIWHVDDMKVGERVFFIV